MNVLELMNQRLIGLDDDLYPTPPESNAVFIVGAPRSGTTLITQIIAAAFDIGYISNSAAAFWQAPAMGVRYSRQLIGGSVFTGTSEWGGTHAPTEPHEFGGFWRRMLGYEDMIQKRDHSIDWPALTRSLDQIAEAWDGRQVVYKVFQLSWHIRQFQMLRPSTKWIWIQRDTANNVQSLLRLLAKRQHRWTSSVPLEAIENFNDAEPIERITAQIMMIDRWLGEQFENFDSEAVLQVKLESISSNPDHELDRISAFLKSNFDRPMLDAIRSGLKTSTPATLEFARQVQQCVKKIESIDES